MGNAQQASAFPYEVNDTPVQTFKTGWELKIGWQKEDKKPVSIFMYTLGANEGDSLPMNFLKRFKTIRHPNMLCCIEGTFLESKRQIYVVTERVRPLEHLFQQVRTQKYILSWGIHQVMKAIGFLHERSMVHGNIGTQSIFVNKQGDWKLGGFELMTEYSFLKDRSGPLFMGINNIPTQYLPPELSTRDSNLGGIPVHAIDAWMSGCFLYSLFCKSPFMERSQLKQVENLPQELHETYITLITANPQRRGKVLDLIQKSPYFRNPFVDSCLFLEEINVKDSYEKERFFLKLTKLIDEFPPDYCKYKILPHLVSALDFGGAGSTVLEPLLKIAKNLTEEEYNNEVAPSFVKWFKSSDRQLRINLLENFSTYARYLSVPLINDHIYPSIAQGFLDQSGNYRYLSVKAIPIIVSKMNTSNVNNHLLRCLAKLQTDVEPSIRHYTTLCVAQIADNLTQDTRNKVLALAFTRALRDPHAPTRQAGIQGFLNTIQHYHIRDIATRIVPALSCMTVDPDADVRSNAIQALKVFVKKIEDEQVNFKNDIPQGTTEVTAETMLGWAISAVSSKLIGTTSHEEHNHSIPTVTSSISSTNTILTPTPTTTPPMSSPVTPVLSSPITTTGGVSSGGRRLKEPKEKPKTTVTKLNNDSWSYNDWDDDNVQNDFPDNSSQRNIWDNTNNNWGNTSDSGKQQQQQRNWSWDDGNDWDDTSIKEKKVNNNKNNWGDGGSSYDSRTPEPTTTTTSKHVKSDGWEDDDGWYDTVQTDNSSSKATTIGSGNWKDRDVNFNNNKPRGITTPKTGQSRDRDEPQSISSSSEWSNPKGNAKKTDGWDDWGNDDDFFQPQNKVGIFKKNSKQNTRNNK